MTKFKVLATLTEKHLWEYCYVLEVTEAEFLDKKAIEEKVHDMHNEDSDCESNAMLDVVHDNIIIKKVEA